MSKGDNAIQGIKNHRRVNHLVVVKLSKIFDLCNALLIEFEIIDFQAKSDGLQNIVHHTNNELLMIAVQSTSEDSQQVNIAVLYFVRSAEHSFKDVDDLVTCQHVSSHRVWGEPPLTLPSEVS